MKIKDMGKAEIKGQKITNVPESDREEQLREAALLIHRLSENQLMQILKEISG